MRRECSARSADGPGLAASGSATATVAGRAVPARLERRPARARGGSARRRAAPRAPQSASSRSAEARSRPSAVSAYDIRGGRCWYGVATTIRSRSRRRSRSVRMFGAIPGSASAELVEPARAVQQRLDEQQAPAVADAVERGLERRRRRGRRSVGHRLDGRRGVGGLSRSLVSSRLQVTSLSPSPRHTGGAPHP